MGEGLTEEVLCPVCGTLFLRPVKQRGRPRTYCSLRCRQAAAPPRPVVARYERDCAICGKVFRTPDNKTVSCGVGCGKVLANWVRSAAALASRTRRCERCDVVFVMLSPSGKAMKGESNEGRFCSKACQGAGSRLYVSRAEAKRAAGKRRRQRFAIQRTPGPCEICGTMIAVGGGRKACSTACSNQLKILRMLRRNRSTVEHERKPRACRECGSVFLPEYGDKRRHFCSAECNKAWNRRVSRRVRRARIKGVRLEAVDPLAVFERDGWNCYICGQATPKKLRGTQSPNAPELDHVIPISAGGGHTYANTACCCRACNSAKGAKVNEQSLLFVRSAQAGF